MLIQWCLKGHPAENHTRSGSALREAYFGEAPVANLLVVAVRDGRIIGMGQWTRIYDMFWSMYGGNVEWLYVRPEHRRSGVVTATFAAICAEARNAGCEFLHGGGSADTERLYELVAIGYKDTSVSSRRGLPGIADLVGLSPREMVRKRPDPELCPVPGRSRSQNN